MLRLSHSLRLAGSLRRPAPGALPALQPLLLRRSSTAAAAAAAAAPAPPPLPLDLVTSAGAALPDLTLRGPSFLDAGLQVWEPLSYVQYGLMQGVAALHEGAGLEWWGAIAAASLGLRVSTFFLCFVRSARMGAWMQHHAEALAAYADRMAAQRRAGDAAGAAATTKEYFAFMASKDMNLLKNIVAPALAQVVVFASFFTGLRRLGAEAHLVPGLGSAQAVAGTWLAALHLPDPTLALPIVSALLSAAAIAANPNMAGVPQAELTPGGQKVVFGAMSTLFNLAAAAFPSVRGRGRQQRRRSLQAPPLQSNACAPFPPHPLSSPPAAVCTDLFNRDVCNDAGAAGHPAPARL